MPETAPKAPQLGGAGHRRSARPTSSPSRSTTAVVYEAVRAEQLARRRGTAATRDARRGQRRRREAVAPEGHRPRARRLDPRAALDGRRRRVRPHPARLHRQGQPQGAPARAAGGAQRARPARQRRGRRRALLRAALDAARPPRRSTRSRPAAGCCVLLGDDEADVRDVVPQHHARLGAAGARRRGRGRGRRRARWSSRRPRSRTLGGSPAEPAARSVGAGGRVMDARQVIRSPVISEKSYALIAQNKYTFRVHPDAHKTQIRARGRGDLRRARGRRAHDEDEAQAQAARLDDRPHAQLEEGDRRAGARRAHRAVRGRRGRGSE